MTAHAEHLAVIAQASIFHHLDAPALRSVMAYAVAAHYQEGEFIFDQDEPAERVYVLAEGRLRLLQLTPEGEAAMARDAATLAAAGPLAFTTDAFVVKPLFFPGGDIGKLAVCGTVNDLAVMGATPRWLSASFIIEEGLELAALAAVVSSLAAAAREAEVVVACGDTKVVRAGEADGLFVTTSGIGIYENGRPARGPLAAGDKVVINGPVGAHGLAVLMARAELKFDAPLVSDCAPLAGLCAAMRAAAPGLKFMRDPTRGGLAAALNEVVRDGVNIELDEAAFPTDEGVAAAAEVLGLDPLYIANEGKVVAVVPAAEADALLAAMRAHPLGAAAAVIGEVVPGTGRVLMKTAVAGTRVVTMPAADQLPRIC